MMIISGDTTTCPAPDPLWFVAPSTYTFKDRGPYEEITPTNFPSMLNLSLFSSNEGSTNSAIKSPRTWPFIEVQGMYLMSKTPRIVAHFATLLV